MAALFPGADPEVERELTHLDRLFAAGDITEELIVRWGELLALCRCATADDVPVPPADARTGWVQAG